MMRMTMALAMQCPVCGVSNLSDPIADGHSVALFGTATVEHLIEQGICPRCLRVHQPWTAEEQNRLAAWIVGQVKDAVLDVAIEKGFELAAKQPVGGSLDDVKLDPEVRAALGIDEEKEP